MSLPILNTVNMAHEDVTPVRVAPVRATPMHRLAVSTLLSCAALTFGAVDALAQPTVQAPACETNSSANDAAKDAASAKAGENARDRDARRIRGQGYDLVLRLDPARIEVGKPFTVLLSVCSPTGPMPVDTLRVDAQMPEHRHGMNYTPIIKALGPGRYQAQGMVFHMPGRWQFLFDVRTAGRSDRLVLDQAVR